MLTIRHMLFFVIAAGCNTANRVTTNGYTVDKKPHFRLKNRYSMMDTLILSPSAIYMPDSVNMDWFKFYPDGRVLCGYMSKVPKNMYDAYFAFPGYYLVKGHQLRIELYYAQKDWFYLELEGTIYQDGSFRIFKDHERHSKRNIEHFTYDTLPGNAIYRKRYLVNAVKPPDW